MIRARILVMLLALLSLPACRERTQPDVAQTEQPDTGGTLVVAITNEPDAVNSLVSGERFGQEINRSILYLPLIQYDENLQLQPLLAESWELHGDTAATFRLRRDVRWHDGAPTTAHDVAFTFERGRDPETGYPNADYWVGWRSVQVPDSFTVRFSFEPQPEALANLPWIPIMPAHLLRDVPPAQIRNAGFNESPVGNGPFRFVEHRANDRWVFEANRQFPRALGGRPYVDRLVLRIVPDPTAQETELRTGRVHLITSVTANKYASLDQLEAIRGVVKPGKQFVFIAWNTKRKPFDDVRVRRALAFAIDREKIVQVVRKSFGQVAAGPVPPFHWSNDSLIKPLPYNPDSARSYLSTIGPLTIELKYAAASETQRDIAELVRADLQAVGVRLVPRALEFGTLVEDVTSRARNFEAAIFAFETDFKLVLHDMFHSRAIDNPYQFASYRNPTVDTLLDRLARTTSRELAAPMWRQLQTTIRDEQPLTFLFYFPDLLAAREELKGQRGDIRGMLFNVQKWWLSQPDTIN